MRLFLNKISKYERTVMLLCLLLPMVAFATDGAVHEESLTHRMANLAVQLSIILMAAHIGGVLFKKLKMPSVLGELIAGIVLGPSLLGNIPIPFLFERGLFPLISGGPIPVQPELYAVATIGSVILLFLAGLETDLPLFARFSIAGSIVGVGGVVVSFTTAILAGAYWFNIPFTDPKVLLLGVISTATSVGITVRVLADKNKLSTPEGMTILAGAVVDDILGIIILAVVLGLSALDQTSSSNQWMVIGKIIITSVGVWLGFTIVGLLFSHKISKLLKAYNNFGKIAVQALGLALLLAGIFEKAGLAMVIGAYIMGLSLSKTDLVHIIEEALHPLREFFVPVFFVVMGMLVNVGQIFNGSTLLFGLLFTGSALAAKIIGCALPALALKFNKLGALRIGLGMVPRGEVALIVSGIGLSSGILDQQMFSAAILMTLLTTIVAPPLLNMILNEKSGTSKEFENTDLEETIFDLESADIIDFIGDRVVRSFADEGFYINTLHTNEKMHRMRKEETAITLYQGGGRLRFVNAKTDTVYVKSMVYENLVLFDAMIKNSQKLIHTDTLKQDLIVGPYSDTFDLKKVLMSECIIPDMKSKSKQDAIEEIVTLLCEKNRIEDKRSLIECVMERERSMSTGMQNGIALPHGKTDAVDKLIVAIGIHRDGIEFSSIDGKPSRIFICAISPKKNAGPHIRLLAHIGSLLHTPEMVAKLLALNTREQIRSFFS